MSLREHVKAAIAGERGKRMIKRLLIVLIMFAAGEIVACVTLAKFIGENTHAGCSAEFEPQAICDEVNRPQDCRPCPRPLCKCDPHRGWYCPFEPIPVYDLAPPPDLAHGGG